MTSSEVYTTYYNTLNSYINQYYTDYAALKTDLKSDLASLSLSQDETDYLDAYVDVREPFSGYILPDAASAMQNMTGNLYWSLTSASVAKYKDITHIVTLEHTKTQIFGGTKLGDAVFDYAGTVEETTLKIHPTNIGAVAKTLAKFGLAFSVFTGAIEVYNSPDPETEVLKQALMLGVGGAVAASLAGPLGAGYWGLTLATVVGGLAGEAAKFVWNNIDNLKADAITLGKTAAEFAEDIVDEVNARFDEIMDATGETAQDFLDAALTTVDDLIDGLGEIGAEFGNTTEQLPAYLEGGVGVEGAFGTWFEPLRGWGDPLALDLDDSGDIEVLPADSVYFDIDNDGQAESVSWISGEDGWLARDVNQNGVIDNVTELFGASGDGFADLSLLDTNADGKIDTNDAAYGELLVWQDKNSDGISQADELFSVADDLFIRELPTVPAGGFENVAEAAVGQIHAEDIFLNIDNRNAVNNEDIALDFEVIGLPEWMMGGAQNSAFQGNV